MTSVQPTAQISSAESETSQAINVVTRIEPSRSAPADQATAAAQQALQLVRFLFSLISLDAESAIYPSLGLRSLSADAFGRKYLAISNPF